MMADETAKMPGVYVDLEDLIALEHGGRKASFLPRQPVHSLLSGRFASRMRGRGLNFEEIRDYRSGDDVRSIDWKVTARLQKPHVRVFNEERDRQALLVVDQRLSMFFGSRLAMKSVTAAEAAAIGAWRILAVGDRVGAIVFNDSDLAEIRPRHSRATVLQILSTIVAQNQALGVGRGLATAPIMLNTALQRAQRLALHDAAVIIISDFDGADDETRKMVGAMTRHNNVVGQQKLLILLTDGNDTASRVPPEHAADIARQNDIEVYTVGVGDPAASGENRVDLGVLKAVASTTHGQFFRAEDGAQLEAIYADIDRLAPAKLQTLSWRPKLPLFQWPLGAATILSLSVWLALLIGSEWSRRRAPSHA
jgi:uncharacterized protein (DUF58 family)